MSGPERQAPDGTPDDQLLDDFLAGRSPVGKAYRDAAHESTPPALDEAVLREAHEQMLQPPAAVTPNQDHFRDRRWPFALAAVLVLSFSTLMLLREEQAKEQAAILPPPVAPEALPAEMAEPQADAASRSRPEVLQRRESAPAAAAPPPPPALRAQSKAEAPAAAMEMEAAPAPQPAAPAAAAPALHDEVVDEPAAKSRAAAGMAADSAEERKQNAETPEDWLQRIRELQAQGREAEARRELQAWREAYPETVIPEDLRGLLPR